MKTIAGLLAFLAMIGPLITTVHAQDVTAFWDLTRERLNREPMEATVEALAEPLPYKKFRITLRSLDGVRFRAILALPIQGEAPAKPWPIILTVPGYGGTQQGVMLSECQRGYGILQVFPRSQGESAELWKIDGPDKLTWRLEQPDGAYYQGAYADVMRAIDFVMTRKDLDGKRIALVGTSQGGGISLAVAALDQRVQAVVAHLPFLCNFRMASQTPDSLVKKLLDQAGQNNETTLRTLHFFDPWILAPRVRIPVLLSAGGKDTACPLPTIQSVHKRLHGRTTFKNYPNLAHTSCLDFYNLSWTWLDRNFRNQSL